MTGLSHISSEDETRSIDSWHGHVNAPLAVHEHAMLTFHKLKRSFEPSRIAELLCRTVLLLRVGLGASQAGCQQQHRQHNDESIANRRVHDVCGIRSSESDTSSVIISKQTSKRVFHCESPRRTKEYRSDDDEKERCSIRVSLAISPP